MAAGLDVLSVCTHNRTRSVLIAGTLERQLHAAGLASTVTTAGFGPAGRPATDQAIAVLADRGIDARAHVSSNLDGDRVAAADLIITAERFHVVQIGGRWRGTFAKTFTLPELVSIAESSWAPPRRGSGQDGSARHGSNGRAPAARLRNWLDWLHQHRVSPADYVDALEVPEISDPTGGSDADWRRTITEIDDLTTRLAAVLHAQLT